MLSSYPKHVIDQRIAFALDHDIETACWAELVCWAYGLSEFQECFEQRCPPGDPEGCYCGKCVVIYPGGTNSGKSVTKNRDSGMVFGKMG
jgi:hypothetical protein